MASVSKKPLKQSKRQSPWKLLWSTFLWFIMILLVIYLIIAIYLTWQYYQAKHKLEKYALSNLEVMSNDVNAKYDFKKDDLAIKNVNSKLARDLTDALLRYYDNNIQTVHTVIAQIVSTPPSLSQNVGTIDILSFKSDAQNFVVNMSKYIKPSVLQESNYFVRFFSMVITILPLESTETVVREIQAFLQEILSQ